MNESTRPILLRYDCDLAIADIVGSVLWRSRYVFIPEPLHRIRPRDLRRRNIYWLKSTYHSFPTPATASVQSLHPVQPIFVELTNQPTSRSSSPHTAHFPLYFYQPPPRSSPSQLSPHSRVRLRHWAARSSSISYMCLIHR